MIGRRTGICRVRLATDHELDRVLKAIAIRIHLGTGISSGKAVGRSPGGERRPSRGDDGDVVSINAVIVAVFHHISRWHTAHGGEGRAGDRRLSVDNDICRFRGRTHGLDGEIHRRYIQGSTDDEQIRIGTIDIDTQTAVS